MLELHAQPLDEIALRKRIGNTEAGAVVTFTGTVRRMNAGREVRRLEYEGEEALARREFAKIVAEARQQFEFLEAHCAHRIGALEPGETAVWIGVSSAHRSAAFAVCKYLIDELKKRLPIWKKEFYTDGESAWIQSP